MPLGTTRVLTLSFALHFAVLAWVLPIRPPPVIEVFVTEAPVEMVMAEEPPVAEAPEPATVAADPEPQAPTPSEASSAEASPAEASPAEAAPVESATVPAATPTPVPPTPVAPAPAVAQRAVQPRAVTTVVPRPARPAPAPAPAAGGGPGAGTGPATNAAPMPPPSDYVAAVQAVLARQRRYPNDARARGAEGTAWLRFTIRRDGGIVAATVARSSGDPSLDGATEEMAARSVMPPLPESWSAPTMTLMVPISYALR